jgi:hypothetical protein
MKHYQVYSIDGRGGISGDRTLHAKNDDEVIFEVRAMQRKLETQIWDGDRRVARIPAFGS